MTVLIARGLFVRDRTNSSGHKKPPLATPTGKIAWSNALKIAVIILERFFNDVEE